MRKHYLLTFTAARRLIYFLLILSFYILQFIILPRTAFPFSVPLLIPLCVAVSMHEKEFAGMFWGLLTGVLWDMVSPHTDGLMAVIFTIAGLLTGLLTRYTLRNTLQSALLLTAAGALIPSVISLFYSVRKITGETFTEILTRETLPELIISLVLTIPVYLIVHTVSKHFHRERS